MSKIRLFVGQIPREWTELNVVSLFSKYGELQEVTILRHADTQVSKGCAFVTFSNDDSALLAIEELHDKFSPSEGRKIQVRDASAPRSTCETGRLYCSNLAESTTGNQVFDLFSTVGKVLSVSILMTQWNRSKCSCLVEMASRQDALNVIETFHGRHKLPNATMEMAISWARNTGSKNRPGASGSSSAQQQHLHHQQQQHVVHAMHGGPYAMHMAPPPYHTGQTMYITQPSAGGGAAQYFDPHQQYYHTTTHQLLEYQQQQDEYNLEEEKFEETMVQGLVPPPPPPNSGATTGGGGGMPVEMMMSHYPMQPYHPQAQVVFIAVPYGPPSSPLVSAPTSLSKSLFRGRSGSSIYSAPSPRGTLSPSSSRGGPLSPRIFQEGPPGANLHVRNFPQEWHTKDLCHLFEQYGEIISCQTYFDRSIQKRSGLVSFTYAENAQAALNSLNGMSFEDGSSLSVDLKQKDHSAGFSSSYQNVLEQADDESVVDVEEFRNEVGS